MRVLALDQFNGSILENIWRFIECFRGDMRWLRVEQPSRVHTARIDADRLLFGVVGWKGMFRGGRMRCGVAGETS